jgi:hypothetical protein
MSTQLRGSQGASLPSTWAEWLLELGKKADREIRRGAGLEEVTRKLQSSGDTCKLAIVFYRSDIVTRFRALVEDWSRERMVSELGQLYRAEEEWSRLTGV